MVKRSVRGDMLRLALAREAARLMIEHGLEDFLAAKRKAAERMGVTDRAVLPRNTEIEAAMAEHQRLFGAEEHATELDALRRSAVQAMRLLSDFAPRLVGPVLSGTATAHNDILLHLFADTPESVAVQLMERGIPHEVAQRRIKVQRDESVAFPAVRFRAGGHGIEATIFPTDGIRQAPFGPVDGRPMKRATLPELEAMLRDGGSD